MPDSNPDMCLSSPLAAAADLPNPVACALAHPDDASYPVVRAFFNSIASEISRLSKSKISRLTDDEISRLTDDEISRLLKTEFSHLPEAEQDSLMDAEFARVIGIADRIFRFFTLNTEETTPLMGNGAIVSDIVHFFFKLPIVTDFFKNVVKFGAWLLGLGLISFTCEMLKRQCPSPNSAQGLVEHSKRTTFLSKYSTILPPKGLKGIGETYNRESLLLTSLWLKQEEYDKCRTTGIFPLIYQIQAEQHQEGTSRALVPNVISTVDDLESLLGMRVFLLARQ